MGKKILFSMTELHKTKKLKKQTNTSITHLFIKRESVYVEGLAYQVLSIKTANREVPHL